LGMRTEERTGSSAAVIKDGKTEAGSRQPAKALKRAHCGDRTWGCDERCELHSVVRFPAARGTTIADAQKEG
jgi:hypothetical protein